MKIKIIAAALAVVCIIPVFASCADKTNTPADNTTTAKVVDTYDYKTDLEYQDSEFNIMNSEPKYNMIMYVTTQEQTGENVNDQIRKNTMTVQEKFGITITEAHEGFGKCGAIIENDLKTNKPVYDVAYLKTTELGDLMNKGYLCNTLDIATLNTDKSWWDQSLKEDGTVRGQYLYYLSSEAHLMCFESTWATYFNKDLLKTYTQITENPYDIVRNKQWTLSKLYTLAEQGASLNGDESYAWSGTGNSVYGFASFGNCMASFVTGAGIFYVAKDVDGEPFYNFPLVTNVANRIEAIAKITGSDGNGVWISANDETGGKHYIFNIFTQNRSLFMGGEIKAAANEMNNMTSEFGMLPMPMYNEEQDSYYSNILWCGLLLTFPKFKDNDARTERAGAVMDAMSYLAEKNILPEYYSRVSYRGLKDQDSIDMLNIIRSTRYLNWGLAYDWLDSVEPNVNKQLQSGKTDISAYLADKLVKLKIQDTMQYFDSIK